MSHISGLTSEKAHLLLKQYGPNIIEDKNKTTWQKILLRQFSGNKVIYLLVVATIIALIVGELLTAITISIVIVIVIIVGFIQEYRAEQAVQALRNMTVSMVRVYRNDKVVQIESAKLVLGDSILLHSGDIVPADCVIIQGKAVHVNESALTGESQEVIKDAVSEILQSSEALENQRLYMGTSILKGKCVAVVTHIGMNTKLGGIAHLIESSDKRIILTDKINKIVNFMIVFGTIIGLASACLLLMRDNITQVHIIEALILFIALAVSAFPEDLPVVMMATLTTGARRMAAKNAIVNRVGIIETLGEVTVICADKTGTLTKGQMTVRDIICDGNQYRLTGSGFSTHGEILHHGGHAHIHQNGPLYYFLKTSTVCTDTHISNSNGSSDFDILGSSTEGALLVAAHKGGIHREDFDEEIVDEHPFDSDRKFMSVVINENNSYCMYSKGAPEVILHRCDKVLSSNGVQILTETSKVHLLKINELLGKNGMRTIACAYKPINHGHSTSDEHGLVFLGIGALEDAAHDEVPSSIEACHNAGIIVKMITGDQPSTAVTIARQIGLHGEVLTGIEIDSLSDEELSVRIKTINIFARVRPEHKYRIVQALKRNGEIVAMTGDGVNDAPALKEAHVGIAMGKNGTEVTRSVADITLCDDNFATIVTAIREGRVIFKNIRKFVGFQLSCNIAELITNFIAILISPLFGWMVPLITSIQILFMNLITDDVPAIALGQTIGDPFIMLEKPRRKDSAAILNRTTIVFIIGLALSMCMFALVIQYIGTSILNFSPELARSTTMIGFIIIQVANSFQLRSFRKGVFNESLRRNIYLVYAAMISIGATLIVVYTPLNKLFDTVPIGSSSWFIIITATILYLIYVDLVKHIYNMITRRVIHAKMK